jgi:Domain of unknown function (DUF4062)
MAIKVDVLRIFLASPGELSEERNRLEEVVKELNITLGRQAGVRLELVKWETDAYPDFGAEPQAVIDEQVGDDYDIFLGILWTRFGLPTSDAASGTEHEFRRAYSRYKRNPSLMRIMFYFRDGEVSTTKIDAEQLLKVQLFRKELGELGSLYWTYRTANDFVNLARVHLTKQILSWGKGWGADRTNPTPELASDSVQTLSSEPPLELGYLDLFEIFEESFKETNEVLARMTRAVEWLDQKMQERTVDLNRGQAMDISSRMRHSKKVTDALAADMLDFSRRTEIDIPLLGTLYRRSTSAIARAMTMSVEFNKDGSASIDAALGPMRSLGQALTQNRVLIQSFRDIVKDAPRATSAFIVAQNRVVAVLDSLDAEYQGIFQHTAELVKSLEDLAQGPDRRAFRTLEF